jgi:multiple sugar transport system ATP-binding protein
VYVTHDQTEAMTLGDRVAVLKRGNLEQLATPRELYEQPVNLFVAGFIGSPPMNFMPANVNGDSLELPFVTVPLSPELAEKVKGNDILIAGVRPEHFEDSSLVDDDAKGVRFTAPVDVIEWMGNEQYAYLPFEAPREVADKLKELEADLDGESMRTQIVVSLDAASRVTSGEDAELFMQTDRMHLFVPETGDNLTREVETVQA